MLSIFQCSVNVPRSKWPEHRNDLIALWGFLCSTWSPVSLSCMLSSVCDARSCFPFSVCMSSKRFGRNFKRTAKFYCGRWWRLLQRLVVRRRRQLSSKGFNQRRWVFLEEWNLRLHKWGETVGRDVCRARKTLNFLHSKFLFSWDPLKNYATSSSSYSIEGTWSCQ